eukprot:TRINITY_DN10585_c0_g3_i1.p1 TRINITY_DN10585_c0_g3~~TRINITY_DN10585_c0_g3_i1.p1  ORF type:complete len:523 (+),score=157.41 TRINITY_DN10585_c0_g3_i1:122-1690(+)
MPAAVLSMPSPKEVPAFRALGRLGWPLRVQSAAGSSPRGDRSPRVASPRKTLVPLRTPPRRSQSASPRGPRRRGVDTPPPSLPRRSSALRSPDSPPPISIPISSPGAPSSAGRRGKVVHVCELAAKRTDHADFVGWDGVEGIRKHTVVIPPHVKSMGALFGIASRTIGWTGKDGKRVQSLMTSQGVLVTEPGMLVEGDILMASHREECSPSPEAKASGADQAIRVRIVPPGHPAFTPALIPVTLHPHARCDIVSLCNAIAKALPGSPAGVVGLQRLTGEAVTDPMGVDDEAILRILVPSANARPVAAAPLALPITVGLLPNGAEAGVKVEATTLASCARMTLGALTRHVGGRVYSLSGLEVKEPNHIRDGELLVVAKEGEPFAAPSLDDGGIAWSPLPEAVPQRIRAALTVAVAREVPGSPKHGALDTTPAVLPAWASRDDVLYLLAKAAGLAAEHGPRVALYTSYGAPLLRGCEIDLEPDTPVVVVPAGAAAPLRRLSQRHMANPRRLSILLPKAQRDEAP